MIQINNKYSSNRFNNIFQANSYLELKREFKKNLQFVSSNKKFFYIFSSTWLQKNKSRKINQYSRLQEKNAHQILAQKRKKKQ